MDANIVLEKKQDNDLTLEELEKISQQQYDKINLNSICDYISPEDLMQKLFMVKSKLTPKGKIIIQSYDLYELCSSVIDDRIPTIEFNKIIKNRKQLLSIPDLLFILNKLNFKILSKDIDALKFLIEAENV